MNSKFDANFYTTEQLDVLEKQERGEELLPEERGVLRDIEQLR